MNEQRTTSHPGRNTTSPRVQHRFVAVALLGLVWLNHFVMNWLWLQANVTILGSDKPGHLARSMEYFNLTNPISISGIVNALTWPSFYPPFFHLSLVSFYHVFGVSADVGALTNAVYLAILLFAVYGIGKQMYDGQTGLLAACLVSLLPIVFLMSRFTYIEFAMLALVALSVWLLLKTEQFRNRGWSYALGVCLGLGLLTKWVFVIFAGPPVLYVFLRSPVLNDLVRALRPPRPQWKALVVAISLGLTGSALFYIISGDWEARERFGITLAIVYWILFALLSYLVMSPTRPFNNLIGCAIVTLCVSAIWYIPNSDFLSTALYKAFYIGSTERAAYQFGSSFPVGPLFRGVVNEQTSLPIASIAAVLVVIWAIGKKGRLWPLSSNVWLLGLWLVIPFAFFASFSNPSSWNMRLTMCLVLPVAIILARACLSLRQVRIRRTVIAGLLFISGVQWVTLSLDSLAYLPERTHIALPGWGEANWFAQGEFLIWPNSGPTAREYWVFPAIFDTVEANRTHTDTEDITTVGLLVNQAYLNNYQAQFVSQVSYPDIAPIGLFRDRGSIPVYAQIFSMDFLLVSDSEVGDETSRDQSTVLVTAILTDPPQDFQRAFQEIATFHMPNEDVVHLYKNMTYEPPARIPEKLAPRSIEHIVNVDFGNQLLLIGYTMRPDQAAGIRKLTIELYWLGLQKMDEDYVITLKLLNNVYQVWGQQEDRPGWGSFPTQDWTKGEVVKDVRELPILPGTPPGSYLVDLVIYGVHAEDWLLPDGEPEVLLGPVDIPQDINPSTEALDIQHTTVHNLSDRVELRGYNIEGGSRAGDNIHLTLFWQALQSMDASYTVFNQLIGPDGQVWGQKDNPPAAGFHPTDAWIPGEIVRDQYDISISPDAPAGSYQIHLGMYLPGTGERLPLIDAAGRITGDHVTLSGLAISR